MGRVCLEEISRSHMAFYCLPCNLLPCIPVFCTALFVMFNKESLYGIYSKDTYKKKKRTQTKTNNLSQTNIFLLLNLQYTLIKNNGHRHCYHDFFFALLQ